VHECDFTANSTPGWHVAFINAILRKKGPAPVGLMRGVVIAKKKESAGIIVSMLVGGGSLHDRHPVIVLWLLRSDTHKTTSPPEYKVHRVSSVKDEHIAGFVNLKDMNHVPDYDDDKLLQVGIQEAAHTHKPAHPKERLAALKQAQQEAQASKARARKAENAEKKAKVQATAAKKRAEAAKKREAAQKRETAKEKRELERGKRELAEARAALARVPNTAATTGGDHTGFMRQLKQHHDAQTLMNTMQVDNSMAGAAADTHARRPAVDEGNQQARPKRHRGNTATHASPLTPATGSDAGACYNQLIAAVGVGRDVVLRMPLHTISVLCTQAGLSPEGVAAVVTDVLSSQADTMTTG
jgi:hypothetical protein